MTTRILVIEDDPAIGPRVTAGLVRAGFDAVLAADGATAVPLWTEHVDLVVLDWMLPQTDGLELLERYGQRHGTPVIVLTARNRLEDRLAAFAAGATDYLAKPFYVEELVARIRARLGGSSVPAEERTLMVGSCVLDLRAHRVTRDGHDLALTTHELTLLSVLVQHPDRAFTRAQLAQRALPEDSERLERTIDSHVYRIRKKLGSDAHHIETVRHLGYRFAP